MALDASAILDAIVSHAQANGKFERVLAHEPKNAPGNGLSAAVWAGDILPIARVSGLDKTSALLSFSVRVYMNMLYEPQDDIDRVLLDAVGSLMNDYTGEFTLAGAASWIDLVGMYSQGMLSRAGYLELDKTLYRVMTITLPVVVADVWTQVA